VDAAAQQGTAADTKQLAVIDLWYRSNGRRLCPSVGGQRCLLQLSAKPLGNGKRKNASHRYII